MKWLHNVGYAAFEIIMSIDRFVNALLLGDPDESLSSRFGRQKDTYKFYKYLCLVLSLFDRNHCEDAVQPEEGSDQIAPFNKSK